MSVAVLAESDSYLKWAVTTAAALPTLGPLSVAVVQSPSSPSAEQRRAALVGTVLDGQDVKIQSVGGFARHVSAVRPDVVILACTGPTATVVQRALARGAHRPVLVAGIPGVALPARAKAWSMRAGIDLFLVHSHREAEEYAAARERVGATGRIAVTTLPYLRPIPRVDLPDEIVFATQAKVPQARAEREAVLRTLATLAGSRPEYRVVVKTRGGAKEFHTHHEAFGYEDLWQRMLERGDVAASEAGMLVFDGGAMSEHLSRAAGFVTVSSTAALEAMTAGVPLLLIDEFGVGPDLINECFVGSGVMAGLDALAKGEFRDPDPGWKAANYFHHQTENTALAELESLIAEARAGTLPTIAERMSRVSGVVEIRNPRRRVLDRLRTTKLGAALARRRKLLRRRVQR